MIESTSEAKAIALYLKGMAYIRDGDAALALTDAAEAISRGYHLKDITVAEKIGSKGKIRKI